MNVVCILTALLGTEMFQEFKTIFSKFKNILEEKMKAFHPPKDGS